MSEDENIKDLRGKKAMIIGDHPHQGATVIYMGLQITGIGLAMRFRNENTDEEFYVF